MTSSSKKSFALDLCREFESTDDDKTPEYPLSDDHPLSLISRTKILNSCKLGSSSEMEVSAPSTGDAVPNQTTHTFINSSVHQNGSVTNNGHHVCVSQDHGFINYIKKCPSHSACKTLTGKMAKAPYKICVLEQDENKITFIEALDLASGPCSEFRNPKAHVLDRNAPLCVRSLIDFFSEGQSVVSSDRTGQIKIGKKLTYSLKAPVGTIKSHEYYSVPSTDSNNNEGRNPRLNPDLKKELLPSLRGNDLPNPSINSELHDTPPDDTKSIGFKEKITTSLFDKNHTDSKTSFVGFNTDIEDKNAPPQLSPEIDLVPKLGIAVNLQSPVFPPILSPLQADASCISFFSNHSSIRNDSKDRQMSKPSTQNPSQRPITVTATNPSQEFSSGENPSGKEGNLKKNSGLTSSDHTWDSKERKKSEATFNISPDRTIETTNLSLSKKRSIDDAMDTRESPSPKDRNLGTIGDLNSSGILSEKDSCEHYWDSYSNWKRCKVPKMSISSTDDQELPNDPYRRGCDEKEQVSLMSADAQSTGHCTMPYTFCQDSDSHVYNGNLKGYHKPYKSRKIKSAITENTFAVEKTKGPQTFLSTEAISVTSGESTLCYPYMAQKSVDNLSSSTKESGTKPSLLYKNTNIFSDGITQAKTAFKSLPLNPFFKTRNISTTLGPPLIEKANIIPIPPSSLKLTQLPCTSLSALPTEHFPTTTLKHQQNGTQVSSIAKTKHDSVKDPHYDRITGIDLVTNTAHSGGTNCCNSFRYSPFVPKISTHQAKNASSFNIKNEKRVSDKRDYVFTDLSRPLPAKVNWQKQKYDLDFSAKLNARDSNPLDSETIERGKPFANEVIKSVIKQEGCQIGVNSTKVNKVHSAKDISSKRSLENERITNQISNNPNRIYENLDCFSKIDYKCADLVATSSSVVSGTRQPEPMDLSRKPSPLLSTHSASREVMVKSMAKIQPYVRFSQSENGKAVFGRKGDHSHPSDDMPYHNKMKSTMSQGCLNYDVLKDSNKMSFPEVSGETIPLVKTSGEGYKKSDTRVRIKSPISLEYPHANEPLLLSKPKHIIDQGDNQMGSPPTKSPHMKESRKVLPVDNYFAINPDEKSYSSLAFAAITLERKKSLGSCMIPSENEDFLDFLRRDVKTSSCKRAKKDAVAIFDRIQNGELIDLTKENDDILSVSSDETNEHMTILTENITDEENTRSFHDNETYELKSMFAKQDPPGRNEDINQRQRDGNVSQFGTTDIGPPEIIATANSIPGLKSKNHEKSCDEETDKLDRSQCSSWPIASFAPSAVFDYSTLSHMKAQSLTFSPPQKAKMAKRIQEIISKNTKLLPDYMQQSSFGPFRAYPEDLSDMPAHIKSDGELSISSCTNSPHNVQSSIAHPLKMKRSQSLEDNSANFAQLHDKGTAQRCSSAIDSCQSPHPQLPQTCTKGELTKTRVQISSPRNEESNSEESSLYKTVWQTQFFTGSISNCGSDDKMKISEQPVPRIIGNGDLEQRLELKHDASNSLNRASNAKVNRESISRENSSQVRRKRRRSTTKMSSQPKHTSGEISNDPLLHSIYPDSHPWMDNVRMVPSVSKRHSHFIPSTFVMAPYYAMAYPLCYPAFQRTTASNQPIIPSHHSSSLDVDENRASKPNERSQTKIVHPSIHQKKKRRRKANGCNSILVGNADENECNEIFQSLPQPSLAMDLNLINTTKIPRVNVPNSLMAKTYETTIFDTQRAQGSNSPGDHNDIRKLLASDNNSYILQTRNEDGLTVLSMQCAAESKSRDIGQITFGHPDKFCNSVQNNYLSSYNTCISKPFFARADSSSANSQIPAPSVPTQPVNVANLFPQNLSTLALASEAYEKIQNRAHGQLGTEEKMLADPIPLRMEDGKVISISSAHMHTHEPFTSTPEDVTTQNQMPVLDAKLTGGIEVEALEQRSTMHGITEKEKLVTEMLAAMMQNRNLTLNSSYLTNTDSSS